jgi:hypothetical protein
MDDKTKREKFDGLVKVELVSKGTFPSKHDVEAAIDKATQVAPLFGIPLDADWIADRKQELLSDYMVTFNLGHSLTDDEYTPWLKAARPSIDPYYWERYKKFLIDERGWTPGVVSVMDQMTETVLDYCGDPRKPEPWDKRGLVMGHVQSGKTANYVGLIAKAADAGYKIVIVIAGIQNLLRNQTQSRIDEGFIGYDSVQFDRVDRSEEALIGVGLRDHDRRPMTLTNRIRDFNKRGATLGTPLENQKEPVVFVVKKNSSVLGSLLDWLRHNGLTPGADYIQSPLLLIDDEADNASINTKYHQDEVTAINKRLRQLLNLFSHSAYVGYTATPFANIFIDPDTYDEDNKLWSDLFPKSFIVSLDAPSNYFDAQKIFIDHPAQYLRIVDDNDPLLPVTHGKDLGVGRLPESLLKAIRCFVLSVAIRSIHGQSYQHCSMLINVSRFVDVQKRVWVAVSDYGNQIADSCRLFASLPPEQALGDPILSALKRTWEEEYGTGEDPWSRVQEALAATAPSISTALINGKSADRLDYEGYETGRKVIAVGGLALSRGLTLEGLTVSYYLRRSVMYDTLMQMGRWFGYRGGYENLCRVFMTEESAGHYEHVAESVAELQQELKQMMQAGANPTEFGLKVRSHPDMLMVTARNKMGASEEKSWSIEVQKHLVETSRLDRRPISLNANRELAVALANKLMSSIAPERPGNTDHYLFTHVPATLATDFLQGFRNSPLSALSDPSILMDYIRPRMGDELAEWDILFASVIPTRGTSGRTETVGEMDIRCQTRTIDEKRSNSETIASRKDRVASRGVEKFGLPPDLISLVDTEWQRENPGKSVPDARYRAKRERPLLIIHFIDYLDDARNPILEHPAVAWSISFPATLYPNTAVKYRLNAVAAAEQRRLYETDTYDDDLDEDYYE